MATRTAPPLAANDEVQIEWVVVNADVASRWLETMSRNRSVSQQHVQYLASVMKLGQWEERAADPIKFDVEGRLADGQHRLWAVLEAGVSLRFLVVRGVPVEAMAVFDTGRKRSLKDFLHIQGEQNPEILSAAIYFLLTYQRQGEFSVRGWLSAKDSITAGWEFLQENKGLRDMASGKKALAKLLGGGRGLWCAIHYELARIDYDDAQAFIEHLENGVDLKGDSAIGALRQRLLKERVSARKLGVREFSALILKAWNLFRRGDKVQSLSWRGGGVHPEEYPIPE